MCYCQSSWRGERSVLYQCSSSEFCHVIVLKGAFVTTEEFCINCGIESRARPVRRDIQCLLRLPPSAQPAPSNRIGNGEGQKASQSPRGPACRPRDAALLALRGVGGIWNNAAVMGCPGSPSPYLTFANRELVLRLFV